MASDLGLHCLHMSNKMVTRLIWVKTNGTFHKLLLFKMFYFRNLAVKYFNKSPWKSKNQVLERSAELLSS